MMRFKPIIYNLDIYIMGKKKSTRKEEQIEWLDGNDIEEEEFVSKYCGGISISKDDGDGRCHYCRHAMLLMEDGTLGIDKLFEEKPIAKYVEKPIHKKMPMHPITDKLFYDSIMGHMYNIKENYDMVRYNLMKIHDEDGDLIAPIDDIYREISETCIKIAEYVKNKYGIEHITSIINPEPGKEYWMRWFVQKRDTIYEYDRDNIVFEIVVQLYDVCRSIDEILRVPVIERMCNLGLGHVARYVHNIMRKIDHYIQIRSMSEYCWINDHFLQKHRTIICLSYFDMINKNKSKLILNDA
jgi:hypothetical protein